MHTGYCIHSTYFLWKAGVTYMKTSRQEKKFRKKVDPDPDLLEQLNEAIGHIDSAMNHFEHVVDPTLIDCYIYELKAAQLRYQFLLKRIKNQEVQV